MPSGKDEVSFGTNVTVPFFKDMNVKNEIAHVRFKTRMNGNMKILSVEEMQSDFAIAAIKAAKTNQDEKEL